MNMSNEEYSRYASQHMPRSHMGQNMLRAFVVGGAICTLGQGLTAACAALGLDRETAGAACSVTLLLFGVVLTGRGVYDRLAKFAGAGALVAITGFANAMASPALEFKTEGKITGTAAKMFVIAGPVIVFGVSAGAACGLFFWLRRLL